MQYNHAHLFNNVIVGNSSNPSIIQNAEVILLSSINNNGVVSWFNDANKDISMSWQLLTGAWNDTEWVNVSWGSPLPIEPILPGPTQPTNAEVAQLVSDLYIDLQLAGVI